MSIEIEMTSSFYVKKTLIFTVSNKFCLFSPGIKQIINQPIWIHKIMNIKMCDDILYSITNFIVIEI